MGSAGHAPVLASEVLSFLEFSGEGLVVDATLGGGGHAEAFLKRMEKARLIGMDRDREAVERCGRRLAPYAGRVSLHKAHFAELGAVLEKEGAPGARAMVFDLGVSSYHLDDPARGFSFRHPGPLDMRLDREGTQTAADIVNGANERELASIFRKYGEEKRAGRIARAIVAHRSQAPIETTDALARIVEQAAGPHRGARRIHPATKVFQALRIAVNRELEGLGEAIAAAVDALAPGGRIAVISFHSLEDRIVKNTFRDLTTRCVCPKESPVCVCGRPGKLSVLTKKPVVPGAEEISQNPRARSARLRVAERLAA